MRDQKKIGIAVKIIRNSMNDILKCLPALACLLMFLEASFQRKTIESALWFIAIILVNKE